MIVMQLGWLVPHELVAVTQICPALDPKVTVSDVVPCPDTMVAPDGTLQLYEVAPATAAMV